MSTLSLLVTETSQVCENESSCFIRQNRQCAGHLPHWTVSISQGLRESLHCCKWGCEWFANTKCKFYAFFRKVAVSFCPEPESLKTELRIFPGHWHMYKVREWSSGKLFSRGSFCFHFPLLDRMHQNNTLACFGTTTSLVSNATPWQDKLTSSLFSEESGDLEDGTQEWVI